MKARKFLSEHKHIIMGLQELGFEGKAKNHEA